MAQKKTYISKTSPKGTFVFPKLNEPDYGSKDYPVAGGQYVVRVRCEKSDPKVQAFIADMEKVLEKVRAVAQAKFSELKVKTRKELEAANGPGGLKQHPIFTTIYDEETEEPTGEIEFKFQMPASITIKKGPKAGKVITFKPIIVDARGMPIPDKKLPPIWGGTTGIISFEYDPEGYFVDGSGLYGVKMRLVAAQILELKSGGERNLSSLGFTQQEGLSADDLEDREDKEDTEDSDTDAETDDTPQDF